MLRLRPKLFLIFVALCLTPLLLLGLLNYWSSIRAAESVLQNDLEEKLADFNRNVTDNLRQGQRELTELSKSKALKNYLRARGGHNEAASSASSTKGDAVNNQSIDANRSGLATGSVELEVRVASLLHSQSHFAGISLFDKDRQQLFSAEQPGEAHVDHSFSFHTKDFIPGQTKPDERVWGARASTVFNSSNFNAPQGPILNYTVPVFAGSNDAGVPEAALVGELKLEPIFSNAARDSKLSTVGSQSNGNRPAPSLSVVLDRSGRILYHSNEALKHQLVGDSMPYFQPVANRMFSSERGQESFTSSNGSEYRAAHVTIPGLDLSVAMARNYKQAVAASQRAGSMGLIFAVLLGLAAAWLLASYFQRKTRGIERVTEGVEAIAKGKLDYRIELLSSDDLRPLADNVGLMTKQLREQIAHEAESRQFQSFVRLSAVLTHDLKNAIEALSLIVSNMDRHFDNEAFRADAMKSLTGATKKLKALVTRLSDPVTTLSGGYKRPQPVDLVPMLKKVISIVAEPVRERHRIEVKLSEPVFALIDSDRMEKVIENLILNALEAMGETRGTLTVAAGKNDDGKAFFSVSDTGPGMSRRFIEERLFHPFATTKKKGVGLGLYTCREVVRANGGSIEVESKEGAGTTFRVMLPSATI